MAMQLARYVRPGGSVIANYLRAYRRRYVTASSSNMARALRPYAVKYAARTINRVYRGYKARKQAARKRIGTPVGRDTARHTQVGQVLPIGTQAARNLFSKEITAVTQGPAPNQRNRDILNFRGVKICCNFMNTSATYNLFVNYAIISPKTGIDIELERFFRSNDQERGVDFDNPNLTSMDYHCRSINTDKYNIVTHKRITLASESAVRQNGNKSYSRQVMRYIPIKRQLRYENLGGELGEKCTTPIYFVWWYDVEGQGTEPETFALLNTDLRLISYFRNPPN